MKRLCTLAVTGLTAAALMAFPMTVAHAAPTDAVVTPRAYNKWAWFKDTYWIVPKEGIYSVMHLEDENKWFVSRGQTVFHIQDYFNGYWTGTVVVKLSKAKVPSCQFVLGQVTPEGRVYMTMYSADTGAVTNSPIGTMVWKRGAWTMVNQMTGPSVSGTLSHWAYMVQSQKGDATFKRLPFAKQSVPKFMSSCPKAPPLIVPEQRR
jgi:hypothetical protein